MSGDLLEIDELLNEAIMTDVPCVLVEGIDDIEIYSRLAHRLSVAPEVYAIENIDGFGEGCEHVIKAVEVLYQLPASDYQISSHILGIIDKDVRDFRAELPESEAILVLKYYSIESHFITENVIEHLLELCIKANKSLIVSNLSTLMMTQIESQLMGLYYYSLESLKNATDTNYQADFSYAYPSGRMKDRKIQELLSQKQPALDEFAAKLSLGSNLNTLKIITKGKWLLDRFTMSLLQVMDELPAWCQNGQITTCSACIGKKYDKCLYRLKPGFHQNTLKQLAMNQTQSEEFDYILERMQLMGLTNPP